MIEVSCPGLIVGSTEYDRLHKALSTAYVVDVLVDMRYAGTEVYFQLREK